MQLRCERQGKLWPLGRFIRVWRRCAPASCAVKCANMTHWRVSRKQQKKLIWPNKQRYAFGGGGEWIRTFIRRLLVQLLSMGMALTILCCSQSCIHWWKEEWIDLNTSKHWTKRSEDEEQTSDSFPRPSQSTKRKKVTMQRVNLLFTHFKNKSINHYLPFGNKVIVY